MKRKDILELLDSMGILGDIRQRLGATDEHDKSKDDELLQLDAANLIATQTGWELGDEQWAIDIINNYEELKKAGL